MQPMSVWWPPLWSSDQSSWLQIQRSGFDSRRYQIFWEAVGLERGPLSFVSTIEELLGRKSWGCSLESREYGRKDPSRWQRSTLYLQKLVLTSLKSSCRSVGIVRLRTQATELFYMSVYVVCWVIYWKTHASLWSNGCPLFSAWVCSHEKNLKGSNDGV
jgi:hypothetical protein